MSNVFEGTSVKRYAIRYRKDNVSPWGYPSRLEYDTLEEAQSAIAGLSRGNYELVEKNPVLRYVPSGSEASSSPLLRNMLAETGFKPYILQRLTKRREWEDSLYLRFDTLKAAQSACLAACMQPHRVAAATVDIQYLPVEVSDDR